MTFFDAFPAWFLWAMGGLIVATFIAIIFILSRSDSQDNKESEEDDDESEDDEETDEDNDDEETKNIIINCPFCNQEIKELQSCIHADDDGDDWIVAVCPHCHKILNLRQDI